MTSVETRMDTLYKMLKPKQAKKSKHCG